MIGEYKHRDSKGINVTDCLFCKVVSGDVPVDIVYEDNHVMAFRDISPQAPSHVLVIPKRHVSTINDLDVGNSDVVGHMFLAAKKVAEMEGISEVGYRAVMNCNEDAGQTVFHIHLHVLGGRRMNWPPG